MIDNTTSACVSYGIDNLHEYIEGATLLASGRGAKQIAKTRQSFGLTYDGKCSPIEDLPELQSMLDIKRDGRGEIDDMMCCFTKPHQATKAWIDRVESDATPLTDIPILIPFFHMQRHRITMDLTLPDRQTEKIAIDLPHLEGSVE